MNNFADSLYDIGEWDIAKEHGEAAVALLAQRESTPMLMIPVLITNARIAANRSPAEAVRLVRQDWATAGSDQ
ncbi:hypothetical protein JOF53_006584 [Crossiella equi]|uniref:Uncharacterized protein n=1 Tax=Crossiella equi TaxID=130796 RepID=A0ABS5AMB5_9PSEU|nr:hypothetical protein [Crossiella equi]MBP2477712.1 hypothetical protein [Crossiella equi]